MNVSIKENKTVMIKDSKSLEISCYVLGAGAFGIFFRWMQLQLAYNDNDLPDKSAWNVLVPLLILAAAFVFLRFIKKTEKEKLYLPDGFFEALKNEGKVFNICRWAIGGLMILGSAYLFLSCELDQNATFLRILAVFGVLTGVSFPLLLASANKPHVTSNTAVTLFSLAPILMFAVWLLTSYKQNSINPVQWDYVVEILTLIIALLAFFRVAGFAYGVVDYKKAMFFCMWGAMLCLTTIADSRYLAQQIMFASAALMLIMFNWIMVANLRVRTGNAFESVNDENGFEQL